MSKLCSTGQWILDPYSAGRALSSSMSFAHLAITPVDSMFKLLEKCELEEMRASISDATRQTIGWRTTYGAVGGVALPSATRVNSLLRAARADLRTTENSASPSARVCAAAKTGAYLMMIHPFSDGNGRIGRLIWARALFSLLVDLERVSNFFRVFLHERDRYQSLMRLASEGNPENIVSYWMEVFELAK